MTSLGWTEPIEYGGRHQTEEKACVVLYSCCLTRGIFLEVLPSLKKGEFIKSFKRLIARRGQPFVVYSDNGSMFIAVAKWPKKVKEDEKFHSFLSDQSIAWCFNVSRAPWWGGHFERLIGLFKSSFHKSVGQVPLSWDELCEVVLDIEVSLYYQPLSCVEDDPQFPTQTLHSLLFLKVNILTAFEPHRFEDRDLKKRAKFLKATKDTMWRRWTTEYLRALRERHQMKHNTTPNSFSVMSETEISGPRGSRRIVHWTR